MRIRIAECTVRYEGRLDAHLPSATRLVMVKADGCVAVHADGGAYKPLNWMNAPNTLIDEGDVWIVQNPKGETLTIEFTEIHFETAIAMGEDPGLQKDGVELELQRLLAEQPQTFGEGMVLESRVADGEEELTVQFELCGLKWLAASLANLEILDG